jgi:hypothetical protein
MDCLRVARRLGAHSVRCVYRRTEAEAPARVEELRHAREEGIEFSFLHAPAEILLDDRGNVRGMRAQTHGAGRARRARSAQPGAAGEFVEWECDTVIYALGTKANPIVGQLHARPGAGSPWLHRGRRAQPGHQPARRVCRRRHRHRWRHRDPGHGCRPKGCARHSGMAVQPARRVATARRVAGAGSTARPDAGTRCGRSRGVRQLRSPTPCCAPSVTGPWPTNPTARTSAAPAPPCNGSVGNAPRSARALRCPTAAARTATASWPCARTVPPTATTHVPSAPCAWPSRSSSAGVRSISAPQRPAPTIPPCARCSNALR